MIPRNLSKGLDFHLSYWISMPKCSWLQKLLYYALVTRHPFDGYPSLAVAECITRDHTKESIYLFVSQTHKKLLCSVNLSSNMKPKLLMIDFSLAIISGVLKKYNRQNIKEYLEKYLQIITAKKKCPLLSVFVVLTF